MAWLPLKLPSEDRHPPFLVKSDFGINSYTIYVTDLVHMWKEELQRKEIVKRSIEDSTSIDASEDASQMTQLLDKLKSGIEGREKTSSKIQGYSAGNKDLKMKVTVELPGGMDPLVWTLRLTHCTPDELSAELTLPLLHSYGQKVDAVENLVAQLHDKDHIIQKMVDKIETMGAELGHIFAAAASKKGAKATRQWQESRVRGLAPFRGLECKKEGFDAAARLLSTGTADGEQKPSLPAREHSIEEADFQVQTTPPHIADGPAAGTEDPTDEDDLESQKTKVTNQVASPAVKKKMGVIGGMKKPSPSPLPASREQAPSKKTELGMIGGKKEKSMPASDSQHETKDVHESTPFVPAPATPKKAKLGVIGGKNATPQEPSPQPEVSTKGKSMSPEVEESVEEKANRRRDALKRELEEKAKQPQKKKKRL